ncbi:MAG: MFS transporter, partial [Allobaculum sp.]|nr:MFS transporter [Allobaculum sp.]
IMTPVGGRLVDGLGSKKLTLWAGTITLVSALIMAFVPNLWIFMIMRVIFSMAQGTIASIPYILAREVNPPQKLNTVFGMLATIMAVGGFIGSWLAGFLMQQNLMSIAVAFPCLTLAMGIWLIVRNMSEDSHTRTLHMDWVGLILLSITLACLLLALNFGPKMGWYNNWVVAGFIVGICGLLGLVYWENKMDSPLIPMSLFQQKEYVLLLAIAFTLVYYTIAMNTYLPMAVQNILKASPSISGSLQLPKTIVLVLVPSFIGMWVARNTSNTWKALALGGLSILISCGVLVFTGTHMPIWFIMGMVGLTGFADAFRSVSITPAAQKLLRPQDMGIGTSMIGFFITLANTISATVDGIAYDSLVAKTPGLVGLTQGIDTTFLLSAGVALVGISLT